MSHRLVIVKSADVFLVPLALHALQPMGFEQARVLWPGAEFNSSELSIDGFDHTIAPFSKLRLARVNVTNRLK